jgi:hypothetical protein
MPWFMAGYSISWYFHAVNFFYNLFLYNDENGAKTMPGAELRLSYRIAR